MKPALSPAASRSRVRTPVTQGPKPFALKLKGEFVPGGILAADVGPAHCGWALITHALRPRVLALGECGASPADLDELLRLAAPAHLAVEVVRGYAYEQARTAALFETSHVAGLLEGIAYARGLPALCIPAATWRNTITGTPSPSDAQVADAVPRFVDGIAKRTNAHERDALGLALVAGWHLLKAPRRAA